MSAHGDGLPELYLKYFEFAGLPATASEFHQPVRLKYFSRVEAVVALIRKEFPQAAGIKLGDFGCGLGIISRILSELGYDLLAIDTDKIVIENLRATCGDQRIEWVASNVEDLDYPEGSLDAAIAIELVEHCAHPEVIVEKMFRFVRPGGILIVTTPNGSRLGAALFLKLPSFGRVMKMQDRVALEARQFSADEHLFRFKLKELEALIPDGGELVKRGYFGISGVLFNRVTSFPLKLLPIKWIIAFTRLLPRIPFVNTKTASKVYAVIRKRGWGRPSPI